MVSAGVQEGKVQQEQQKYMVLGGNPRRKPYSPWLSQPFLKVGIPRIILHISRSKFSNAKDTLHVQQNLVPQSFLSDGGLFSLPWTCLDLVNVEMGLMNGLICQPSRLSLWSGQKPPASSQTGCAKLRIYHQLQKATVTCTRPNLHHPFYRQHQCNRKATQ